ncbi:MAG: STAS domain-containing protein [Gammaproteobacteria bacterium]|nr:STAS domain-containing protein [Gammaproteobacteria bacterium]
MATQIHEQNDGKRLAIGGELTIYGVADVKERLWQAAARYPQLEVDLSGVDDFDTAGLQLLLMSKRWPATQINYVNHSAAVLRLIELSNVVLGDPLILSGQD